MNKISKIIGLRKLLLLAFALSGATVLIYEVVWTRPLQLIFGSTIYAVSTMLTTFMVGFTVGSYLFRYRADKAENPALLFAWLEFGIGVYGLIIIPLFSFLPSLYLSLLGAPGFQFLQFALCFAVLITPTTLMGAIWPAINRAYAKLDVLGKDVGTLYSFNSFGCALGSLTVGFLLIPLLGITKTCLLAAFVNLLIALTVYLRVKKWSVKK
jgi:spermidine synthase